ncbi:MAG: Type-1 restriction enzyme EcoKI specificity protein [candidate division WS2 bacterium]|uniref:Type-1 restriction enzyme EcoKI specificity protein n=1 Tax=Psychracetigena formicireducens TaxID=2986056 RepID=A0A9E2F6M1_PSYF1|nr:Type-1 restriction enzyme EcoKI specificity protein [Candidatus Psychracetigena formicireducens]
MDGLNPGNESNELVMNDAKNKTMKTQSDINNSKLPEGWRWVRLGEVCELIMGQSPPGSTYVDKPEGLPFFQGKADFREYFPNVRVWCTQPIKIAEEGDILISVRAPVGPVNMNNLKCCIGRGLAAIRCKDDTINWFIFWYLQSIETQITSLGSGSTFGAITRDGLTRLQIPLPPIEEQKRIASKLQELMQDIERARTVVEKQLEAVKALPSAYLREVFESEEAKKWERKRLGEVCEVFSGSSAPQEKKYFENGKYPFVRVQDLGRYGKTDNLKDTKDHVNDIAIKELKLKSAKKGTILFPKSGAAITTNNRAILGTDAFIVSHLTAVKPKEGIADTLFIYYWLCLTDMIQYMENPGYPSLKLSIISKITIPLPPLEVQQHIAPELKEKMAQVENLESAIRNQQSALDALPQAILRKAFKGEI